MLLNGLQFYEVFLNPDGEYLGWDTIPLPYIYGILIIVYAVLLLAWLGNIVFIDKVCARQCANVCVAGSKSQLLTARYTSFQGAGSNRLHKYISLWPIMKLWLVIFNTAYWGYISERVCAPSSVSSSPFATPSAMASSTRLTRLVSHTSGSHDLGH